MSFSWTDQNVKILTSLWSEGLSASLIAGRLGCSSRSAVIGKVFRLGLPGRTTKIRTKPNRPWNQAPRGKRSHPAHKTTKREPTSAPFVISSNPHAKLQPEPLPPEDDLIGVSTADHTDCMCTWIKNDPRDGAIWCSEPKIPGTSYCQPHLARVFQPITMRPPSAWNAKPNTEAQPARSLREIVNAG